jgi:hypothetical protein
MNSRLPTQDPPTVGEILTDVDPVIGTVFVAGPPLIPACTVSVLFGLLLAGPFALFATLVVAIVAAWALVALVVAILASPFILVRRLRAHRADRAVSAPDPQPAPQLASIRSQQVAA